MSNHGGRQIEALAPSIDCLPGIVSAVGKKATIVLDSGIRSGQDVMRALALGADAAFAGKSFLWAVAALGDAGPAHLIDLYIDELRSSLGQIGALIAGRSTGGQNHPSRRDQVLRQSQSVVMPGHSRLKDGVLRTPMCRASTSFWEQESRGWPGLAQP